MFFLEIIRYFVKVFAEELTIQGVPKLKKVFEN